MDVAQLSKNLSQSNLAYASAAAEFLKSAEQITFYDPFLTGDIESTFNVRLWNLRRLLSKKDADPAMKKLYLGTAEFVINLRKERPLTLAWVHAINNKNVFLIPTDAESGNPLACIPITRKDRCPIPDWMSS